MIPPRRFGWPGSSPHLGRLLVDSALIDGARLQPDERVLDIGCGPGRNAVYLTGYLTEGSYEGFDVQAEAIEWARRQITPRHPSFRFTVLDLHNRSYNAAGGESASDVAFPYEEASFDVVFATSVYTHMVPFEVQHYLAESARVLRPGGRLASTFFLIDEERSRRLEAGIPRPLTGTVLRMEHEFTDERGYGYRSSHGSNPERMLALLEDDVLAMHERAGLEMVELRHGYWAGDADGAPLGQDLVVARRP
jgi:SAM-dependent methyltransferase